MVGGAYPVELTGAHARLAESAAAGITGAAPLGLFSYMQRRLLVFEVPADGGVAVPAGERELEAKGPDELLATARAFLSTKHARVRSVSFAPCGLVAYVEGEVRS
jgi:hypothetical protein